MAWQLWIPTVGGDDAEPWVVISSGLLDAGTSFDRVELFNRGSRAGELLLHAGDGADLLRRLGLEPAP
jgi:hypothetical protein